VTVNERDQRKQADIGNVHLSKALKLSLIAIAATGNGQALLNIFRDKESRTLRAEVPIELGKVDVDARQVKVPEVYIRIGNLLQPGNQIP
jgi:hypothetical protein